MTHLIDRGVLTPDLDGITCALTLDLDGVTGGDPCVQKVKTELSGWGTA